MAIPYAQPNTAIAGGSTTSDVAALTARVMLVAIFLMSALQLDWRFTNTVAYLAANGLRAPEVGAVIAIAIEVFAGLMVLTGWNARWGALVMAIYTVLVALLFHAYWDDPADVRTEVFNDFWKNISIAGGFLMVFAFGPGRYSLGRSQSQKK